MSRRKGHFPKDWKKRSMLDKVRQYPLEGQGPMEFSETPAGQQARYDWAKRYDELNGAPEGDFDR